MAEKNSVDKRNKLPAPVRYEMKRGERVALNVRNGSYENALQFYEDRFARSFGKVSLGGINESEEGESYPPQDIHFLEVTDIHDEDYQALLRRAKAANEPTSRYLLAATSPSGGLSGIAFLALDEPRPGQHPNSIPSVTLGREGDVRWFYFGASPSDPQDEPPFVDNLSVGRQQLEITPNTRGRFSLKMLDTDSKTEVVAARIESPYDGSEIGREEIKEVTTQRGKLRQKLVAGFALTRSKTSR